MSPVFCPYNFLPANGGLAVVPGPAGGLSPVSPEFAMVAQVLGADIVAGVPVEGADDLSQVVADLQVIGDVDSPSSKRVWWLGQRQRTFSGTSGPWCGLPSACMWAPSEIDPPGMSSRRPQTWQWSW